jgi:hypothetical protein
MLTSPSALAAGGVVGRCGARQKSMNEIWWTQLTVQLGAQPFSVRNSRLRSALV